VRCSLKLPLPLPLPHGPLQPAGQSRQGRWHPPCVPTPSLLVKTCFCFLLPPNRWKHRVCNDDASLPVFPASVSPPPPEIQARRPPRAPLPLRKKLHACTARTFTATSRNSFHEFIIFYQCKLPPHIRACLRRLEFVTLLPH